MYTAEADDASYLALITKLLACLDIKIEYLSAEVNRSSLASPIGHFRIFLHVQHQDALLVRYLKLGTCVLGALSILLCRTITATYVNII